MSSPSNPFQSHTLIAKIKSNVFLRKMFSHLKERNKLQILQQNKRIRDRVNISIDDYKNFKKTELIIIPEENKYGVFINIKKEEKNKYHVFFNDEKKEEKNKETKRLTTDIKKIKIILDEDFMSFNELFSHCSCIKSIKFIKFNRTNIDNMKMMFYNCRAKTINLSNWGIRNVKDMSYMFAECICLEKLYIKNINVENVTNVEYMFYKCSKLSIIDLSNLNAKNALNMNHMFSVCWSLLKINLLIFYIKKI